MLVLLLHHNTVVFRKVGLLRLIVDEVRQFLNNLVLVRRVLTDLVLVRSRGGRMLGLSLGCVRHWRLSFGFGLDLGLLHC
jgi:hypothetical protein